MSNPPPDDDIPRYRVSLRLQGDELDPHAVSELLDLEAETIGVKGAPRLGKNGRTYAPFKTNFWVSSREFGPALDFDDQVQALFATLGDRVRVLKDLCAREGIEGELFCGFFSAGRCTGDVISPKTIQLIADAELALNLHLYPHWNHEEIYVED